MASPSIFELAKSIGTGFGNAQREVSDLNALDQILSNASMSQDPNDLDLSINQILQRVSPQNRDAAIRTIENRKNRILEQNKPKVPPGGITAQTIPEDIRNEIEKISNENKDASAEELQIKMNNAGVPLVYSNPIIESRRRTGEQSRKELTESRKETLPLRMKISDDANAAREGIRNKKEMLDLIKNKNLNDPTVALALESFPFNLGKRFLSNDTVAYKAQLIDEYKDLRKIFQGQTRVKELEILEKKLADVYLTDTQKKSIIDARIKSLDYDILKEQAAEEVERENPNIGLLEFNKKVNNKLSDLSNEIIDANKRVIQEAEDRKKFPLDPSNPDDINILKSILIEAGGDKKKARKIAKSKGYKLKG